ncbi:MAG: hypothetical protein ACT4P7_10545 [Gemmatimonadaceae bacterium]
MHVLRSWMAGGLAVILIAGCVDSPASLAAKADSGDPLALTFEELARQAAASGDVSRAEGFTYAAIAARNGVTPSRLDVRTGATTEIYEAFVNSVAWQVATATTLRVPAHRTITAWRRTSDGVTRILTFTTPSDSAPVLHPLSLSAGGPAAAPFAGAGALYQETTTSSLGPTLGAQAGGVFWIAVSGFVKIRESLTGAACPKPMDALAISGVTCQQARFVVRFDVNMQRLSRRPYEIQAGVAPRRVFSPAEQTVSGYKLTFACVTVNAVRGCG